MQPEHSIGFDEHGYREFFSQLTGNSPHDYQVEIAKHLFNGHSIVLRAPTGAGKTWTTVAPFLYTQLKAHSLRFADRLLYALPLRSLAGNLHASTIKRARAFAQFSENISDKARNRKYISEDPVYIGLQMGGQQDDPFFEGQVTFTTIDQLLSSYLFLPVSLPARVGNIGAGSLIGSFVVFDEVHLLDPQRSLATAIEMLDRLSGLAQFVIMTATMPDSVLRWFENKFGAIGKSLSEKEVLGLPSHAKKQLTFQWKPRALNADDVVDQHKDRTIAIVNTVDQAQRLFREVRNKIQDLDPAPRLFLLHARFYPADRKHWESQLESYFGPKATHSNAILISTQVVEAGIDISADMLLTELAPLNSVIQRAGRVARYVHRNTGRILIFELPLDARGRPKLGPYRGDAGLLDATRTILIAQNGEFSLNYLEELIWLEKVHGQTDLLALASLDSLHSHRKYVHEAMDGLDKSACSRLIRDVSSISVVLTDTPESLMLESHRWPQLLSIPRTSLFQFKDALSMLQACDWILKVPQEIESDSNRKLNVTWRTCTNPAEAAWLVAINPSHAAYSTDVGLELKMKSDAFPDVRYSPSAPIPRYSYYRESFLEHAQRVTQQCRRILLHSPELTRRLSRLYPGLDLDTVFELVCALHDVGKLQIRWQEEATNWQGRIDRKLGRCSKKGEPLAHTDFDPVRDRGETFPKFPPHAACGGFALLSYFLNHYSQEVALVMCMAITRHHGTHSHLLAGFEFPKSVSQLVEPCLSAKVPLPITVKIRNERGDIETFSDTYILRFSESFSHWPLYSALVRVLRLADQGSFKEQS